MGDHHSAKYIIGQGKVSDLRKKFEGAQILQKAKSETHLIIDDMNDKVENEDLKRRIEKSLLNNLERTGSNAWSHHPHGRTQIQIDPKSSTLPRKPVPAPRKTNSASDSNKTPKDDLTYANVQFVHNTAAYDAHGCKEAEFKKLNTMKTCEDKFDISATNVHGEDYYEKFNIQNLNLKEVYDDKSLQFPTGPASKSFEFVFDAANEPQKVMNNHNWGAHLPAKLKPMVQAAGGSGKSESFQIGIKSGRTRNFYAQNEKITFRNSVSNGAASALKNDFHETPNRKERKVYLSSKMNNIIEHLKSTESRYLQELKEIAPIYIYVMKHHTSSEIRSKAETLRVIVEELVDIQTGFEETLSSASTLEAVLIGFMDYEHLFSTYKQFFMENGTETNITIADSKSKFKQEITFGGVLNQRLVHYKLILEDIRKELAGDQDYFQLVLCLLENVTKIINSCNIILLLNRVQNNPLRTNINGSLADVRVAPNSHFIKQCPSDVTGYGEYILKDKFKVIQPHKATLTVFLFSNVIIFTEEDPEDVFSYKGYINVKDIGPLAKEKNEKVLKLRNYTDSKRFHKNIEYSLEAFDKAVPVIWRTKIEAILWSEQLNLKENVKSKFHKTVNDILEEQ